MPKNFNMDAMTIHEVANPKIHLYRSICVIATFNKRGAINPLAIRFETENERFDVHIDKVISSHQEWADSIVFHCLVTVGERQQQIKLAYEISNHIWRLI
jgi:hypothetical protein